MENDYNQYNESEQLNEFEETPYEYAQPVPMVSFGGLPPAIEAIKSAAKSPAFLIATICYTLCVIVAMISSGISGLSGAKAQIFGETDMATQKVMEAAYTSSFVMTLLIAMCPMILMLVGMWVIYGGSKKSTPTLKGIGACRAAIIIWDVCMWIVLVCTVILGAVFIAASGWIAEEISYYLQMYNMYAGITYMDVTAADIRVVVSGVIVGIVAVLLLYVILTLIYFTKMLKTTRVVKDIVNNGFSKKKISVYLIVVNFLLIIGSVFSILLSIGLFAVAAYLPDFLYEMGMVGSEIDIVLSEVNGIVGTIGVSIIPQILGIVTIICMNIVLIKLRKKLKQIFVN